MKKSFHFFWLLAYIVGIFGILTLAQEDEAASAEALRPTEILTPPQEQVGSCESVEAILEETRIQLSASAEEKEALRSQLQDATNAKDIAEAEMRAVIKAKKDLEVELEKSQQSTQSAEAEEQVKTMAKQLEDMHELQASATSRAEEAAKLLQAASEKEKEYLAQLAAQQEELTQAITTAAATSTSSSSSSKRKVVHVRDVLDDLAGLSLQLVDVLCGYGKQLMQHPTAKKITTAMEPAVNAVTPVATAIWACAQPIFAKGVELAHEQYIAAKNAAVPIIKDSWKDIVMSYQDLYDICEKRLEDAVKGTFLDGHAKRIVKYGFMIMLAIIFMLLTVPTFLLVRFFITLAVRLVLFVILWPFRTIWAVITYPVRLIRGGGGGGGGKGKSKGTDGSSSGGGGGGGDGGSSSGGDSTAAKTTSKATKGRKATPNKNKNV